MPPQYTSPEILTRTPVKEIIFSISFKENLEVEKLREYVECIDFKEDGDVKEGFTTRIGTVPGTNKPHPTVALDGYLIPNKTEGYTIQPKRGSFNFHKTNGYEKFEDLFELVSKYWSKFQETVGSLTLNYISLRYLNLIQNGEDIADLVTIKTAHPFGENVTPFVSFTMDHQEIPGVKVTVVCTLAEMRGEKGVVLDIHVNKKFDATADTLERAFTILREIKNEVFFQTITDKTRTIYNHD